MSESTARLIAHFAAAAGVSRRGVQNQYRHLSHVEKAKARASMRRALPSLRVRQRAHDHVAKVEREAHSEELRLRGVAEAEEDARAALVDSLDYKVPVRVPWWVRLWRRWVAWFRKPAESVSHLRKVEPSTPWPAPPRNEDEIETRDFPGIEPAEPWPEGSGEEVAGGIVSGKREPGGIVE